MRAPVTVVLVLAAVVAPVVAAPAVRADDERKGLTAAEVVQVMASRRAGIRKKCYDESAAKKDTSVRVDFAVAPSGVVTDATANDVSGPAEIVACVVGEVKRTTFPASETGGRFRWPFIFKGP